MLNAKKVNESVATPFPLPAEAATPAISLFPSPSLPLLPPQPSAVAASAGQRYKPHLDVQSAMWQADAGMWHVASGEWICALGLDRATVATCTIYRVFTQLLHCHCAFIVATCKVAAQG